MGSSSFGGEMWGAGVFGGAIVNPLPAPPSSLSVSILALTNLLAQRLGITLSGNDFWVQAELDLYVRQAIREFQVLTGYWRGTANLATVSNTPFYDINALGLVPFTVNDTDILAQVGYHLLEFSGTQANYINTKQFLIATVTAALDQRREQLFGETRMVLSEYAELPQSPPAGGKITLSNGVIQLHRVDWYDSPSSTWNLLERSDELGAGGWNYGWKQNPALPLGYSVALTRPFEIQLVPPPLSIGAYDMLVTECNPYTFTGTPQLLGLPDDSVWALSWGILASVLNQDAQSRDYLRATYASKRFQAALGVLKSFPMVQQAWPSGVQRQPATIHSLDHWHNGWRNQTPAAPLTIAVAGRNMVAVYPVPDVVYSIELDMIVNSPASIADRTAVFDLAGDIVTAILDDAAHLACFKMGGAEFMSTMELYRNFLSVAEAYANRERVQSINFEDLRGVTKAENLEMPYEATPVDGATA